MVPKACDARRLPSPTPGPGEVLVRIRAVSLNYRDLLISKGLYNPRLRLPLDSSIGRGGRSDRDRGRRHAVQTRRPGLRQLHAGLGGRTDRRDQWPVPHSGATWTACSPRRSCFPSKAWSSVPEHLSFEEAATLPCAAVTAWHALVVGGGLKPGDTVLTQGTGGVSIFALQFARMAGARVISTSGHDEKLARLKELGASDLINYKTTPEWDTQVRALTGGVGVDHVVEVGGAGTLARSIRAVRLGGYIALIGVLSGLGEVNPMPILMKSVRVQGIFVGSRSMFEAMNQAIRVNQLRPVIDQVFPFEDAVAALKHMESGAHFGKVVIRV